MRILSGSQGSLLICIGFFAAALCQCFVARAEGTPQTGLSVVWSASEPTNVIQSFSPEEFKKLKKTVATELDPTTGKRTRFEGVLLSEIIDHALGASSNERKAQIDLVILKNSHGASALIPRSFIVKYPMMLATRQDRHSLDNPRAIVPWTSKPKSRDEGLPLEAFFVTDVTSVELSNYHQLYGNVFLKRRTEPSAMRGEKLFVQTCLACHGNAAGIAKAQAWTGTHPSQSGFPKLDDRELRALHSYLDLFHSENVKQ